MVDLAFSLFSLPLAMLLDQRTAIQQEAAHLLWVAFSSFLRSAPPRHLLQQIQQLAQVLFPANLLSQASQLLDCFHDHFEFEVPSGEVLTQGSRFFGPVGSPFFLIFVLSPLGLLAGQRGRERVSIFDPVSACRTISIVLYLPSAWFPACPLAIVCPRVGSS
jgi:hypothetical protein